MSEVEVREASRQSKWSIRPSIACVHVMHDLLHSVLSRRIDPKYNFSMHDACIRRITSLLHLSPFPSLHLEITSVDHR